MEEHRVVASMRIERYYSSVKENEATMHKDVLKILDDKDYVGFFKSCGPTYVRSIRRAQEVTALFTFKTSDKTTVSAMKAAIESTIYGSGDVEMNASVKKSMNSLQIKIVGYGLGLDNDGADTLVATVSTISSFMHPIHIQFFVYLLTIHYSRICKTLIK